MKTIVEVAQNLIKPFINSEDKKYAANIAPVETSPATAAHTAGTQLIYNGVLYDVTANIAADDPLATTGAGANIAVADKVTEQISSQKQALSDEAKVRAKYGAHNFLNTFDYYDKSETGTAVWTMNADGTWTITGTTGSSQSYVNICARHNPKNKTVLKAGKAYRITGIPVTGCSINIIWTKPDSSAASKLFGLASDPTLEAVNYDRQITFQIGVPANTNTGSGYTFEPMISDPDDPYTGYTPFAKPNNELTKDDSGLTANAFTNGAVNLAHITTTSQTVDTGGTNVTMVVDADKGTITLNGTVTNNTDINAVASLEQKEGVRYKLSGCPSGGGSTTFGLRMSNNGHSPTSFNEEGNGAEFVALQSKTVSVKILLKAGAVLSNVVFKPMITVADMPNSDYAHYVPYRMSNEELTDIVTVQKYDDGWLHLRKQGNFVNLSFEAATFNDDNKTFSKTIPEGFRPENHFFIYGICFVTGTGYVNAKMDVAPNGTIVLGDNYGNAIADLSPIYFSGKNSVYYAS